MENFQVTHILLDCGLILLSTKALGMLTRKLGLPQVVGMILAGLLIGPALFAGGGSFSGLIHPTKMEMNVLQSFSQIGVVFILFSSGLETDFKEMKRSGVAATCVALAGVIVPIALGTVVTLLFMGGFSAAANSDLLMNALFVGCILSATSVGITVETLRELGKLNTKIGTTILSAAIIDDVIGIIVLTFVIGFKNPDSNPGKVVISTILFFVFAIVVGFILFQIFKKIDNRYPHTRRIPILGLALCFALAFLAEKWFGIADITGAYVAGIILCSIRDSEYIAEKMDINSYMLFGPVFFASIGLKTSIDSVDSALLIFSLGFVIVALVTKIVGCGLMAKLCRFRMADSLKIGVGMMTRGEVALIVAQKGLSVGLLEPKYFTAVILLIIVSSISTPIILKVLYAKDKNTEEA